MHYYNLTNHTTSAELIVYRTISFDAYCALRIEFMILSLLHKAFNINLKCSDNKSLNFSITDYLHVFREASFELNLTFLLANIAGNIS